MYVLEASEEFLENSRICISMKLDYSLYLNNIYFNTN